MEKQKGLYKHSKHQCRSIMELYRRISVNFCFTIEALPIPLLERLQLRSCLVETSRPEWISCIHSQKKENKKSQKVKRPLGKMLVNWRSRMLSGCEIIEVHPDGFQVPSPPSLVHGTIKFLQMENSTRDTLINYEVVPWRCWKIQLTSI